MKYGLFIAALLLANVSFAEIYKWVDEQGNVHYGDRPVGQSEALDIPSKASPNLSNSSASSPADSAAIAQQRQQQRQRLLDSYDQERAEKNQAKAERKEKEEKHKRACVQARDKLLSYQRASAIYDVDDDGKRVYISQEEREASEARLRDAIKKNCD